jgi:hypothetical protein
MDSEEIKKARALVTELHKLGGPDPKSFSDHELLVHYRDIIQFESMASHPDRVQGLKIPSAGRKSFPGD